MMRTPRSTGGFTLIELIVVITLIVVFAGIFLRYVPYYQEQAEKVAMEQTAGSIQSALVMQFGKLVTRGQESQLAILATDNPMKWLQKPPPNYAGEFYDPSPRAVAPGTWVFDLKSRDLIYVLNRADYFTPGSQGHKWIRFHTRFLYDPVVSRDGATVGKELSGTVFEPREPYSWMD